MTFEETLEKLRGLDEVTLLELLGLDSRDLVSAFLDEIEENLEKLKKEIDEHE